MSLLLWFFLLLFLPLSPSSSSLLLLLLLCSDWIKLEERGGVGESSLSDDEEELVAGGMWAGLHEELELREKTAEPEEDRTLERRTLELHHGRRCQTFDSSDGHDC